MTNASRATPPFGGREALLGTAPIAIGAPGGRMSRDFILGAAFGGDVGDQYKDYDRPQNVGHLVIALRADLFITRDEYDDRMDTLVDRVHANPPMADVMSILRPSELESQREAAYRQEEIPVGRRELEALQGEATAVGLARLEFSCAPR